jgi:hypothetical protein
MRLFSLTWLGAAAAAALPSVDWRNHSGNNYVTAVKSCTNPPGCDSSWAFAAASMLGDRLTIAQHKEDEPFPTKVTISPQYFLNCAVPLGVDACSGGGEIAWALELAARSGMVDETCMSYRGHADTCDAKHVCINCFGSCVAVTDYVVYNVSAYYAVAIADVRAEVAARGPVACEVRFEWCFGLPCCVWFP